jgi:hypothetical protein
MTVLELIPARVKHPRKNGDGYMALCPVPEHRDRQPSLSIGEAKDGKVLLNCHAGCTFQDIVAALGLTAKDLFPRVTGGEGGRIPSSHATVATLATVLHGCTLKEYASEKRIPVEFLRGLGLSDVFYMGAPAIRIPYIGVDGVELAVQFRLALRRNEDGTDNRFRWRKGSKTSLYGLWKLDQARAAGYVVLVEGASDCHTLWFKEVPAIGLPGAGNYSEDRDAHNLDGIPEIYVVIEPDRGGDGVISWLERSRLRNRVRLVYMDPDSKDPSALYLHAPDSFRNEWAIRLKAAVPWRRAAVARRDSLARRSWARCCTLAQDPDILARVAETIANAGVVGEERTVKLLYLILTSRFQPRPASAAVKAPSSAGKSFVLENVLKLFPASAYYSLSAMSERALAYSDEPMKNRVLVLFEAAGLRGAMASYLVRSLLSEGKIRYETIEKTKSGLRPKLIEREGPTGLLTTTTWLSLHPENETRLLSIPVTDTPEQTRNVFRALAANTPPNEADYEPWHALQTWLDTVEHRAVIPYARRLVEQIPPIAVRLRRDVGMLLTLIRTHSVLHQATRGRDEQGRVVAEITDYTAVRVLVADLIADAIGATVTPDIRETVAAVQEMGVGDRPVSVSELARCLKLDKSVVSRRVAKAVERGHLNNQENTKGKPAKLIIGDLLPDEVPLLPDPAALECCTVARVDQDPEVQPPSPPQEQIHRRAIL